MGFDACVVKDVFVVVVFCVELSGPAAFEFLVIVVGVAQFVDVGGDGVEGGVEACGGRKVGFFVALADRALREKWVIM